MLVGYTTKLRMLLPRSWTRQTILDSEMPSSPDTLFGLLTGFASLTCNTASEFEFVICISFYWNVKQWKLNWKYFLSLVVISFLKLQNCRQFWMSAIAYTRMSQKFCNILVMWGSTKLLWMLLPRLWMWQNTLEYEMPSSLDTLQVILTTALDSTVLGLPDLTWSSKFLLLVWNFFDQLHFHLLHNKSIAAD